MPLCTSQASFLYFLFRDARPPQQKHQVVGTPDDRVVVTCPLSLRGLALPHPVRIEYVTFEEFVDFSEWRCGSSLRLEHCVFAKGLRMADTRVEGLCSLEHSEFHAPEKRKINFHRLHVGGLFDCNHVISTACLELTASRCGSDAVFDDANIDVVEQSNHAAVNLATADEKRDHVALDLATADVGGSVLFRGNTRVVGRIDLRATVRGQVNFSGARVSVKADALAVDLSRADVGGSVFFTGGAEVTGSIDLRAKVGGQVVFADASVLAAHVTYDDYTATADLPNEKRQLAIDFTGADLGGSVIFKAGLWVRGAVRFNRAKLNGGLYADRWKETIGFEKPDVTKPTRHVLVFGDWDMNFAEVNGPVQLHGVSLCGRFRARHLTVHGDLDLCGSVVGPPSDDAKEIFKEFFARLSEHLRDHPPPERYKWEQFEISREVANSIYRSEGKEPDPERAINLELAEVNGRLWVKRSRVFGTSQLEGATIAGEANFWGDFHGDLILRSAEIKGKVSFDERERRDDKYASINGCIDLSFATVKQVDVAFDPTSSVVLPEYIDFSETTVDSLRLAGPVTAGCPPFVVTNGVRFQTLDCTGLEVQGSGRGVSWADHLRFWLWLTLVAITGVAASLHGSWLIGVVVLYALGTTPAILRAWAALQRTTPPTPSGRLLDHLDETYPFSHGYYVMVERKLREAGDDATADEVFHKRRRREREGPKSRDRLPQRMRVARLFEDWAVVGRATRAWLWFLDFLMGFGVRPGRLVHLYVVLGLLNAAVFLSPRSVERPVAYVQSRTDTPLGWWPNPKPAGDDKTDPMPTNPWPSDGGIPDVTGDDTWNTKHALFMALRVQVPVLTLVAENDWSPATRPMAVCPLISYADYASIMMVVNLILIPLIVAGLTGYLKK